MKKPMTTLSPRICGILVLIYWSSGQGSQPRTLAQATTPCDVTRPNGIVAGRESRQPGSHGNAQLSVGPFGLWRDGTVVFRPGGAGFVTSDGALGMKFGWQRGTPGPLQIEGRRLDAPAAPLRAIVTSGYGPIGFQATYLVFSTPGCWEVTGRIGEFPGASLTFMTNVVKIGEGPAWRDDLQ